ncbi:DUF2149 domain-containing protein [Thalassotalea psychrophila]|uniref:DUF2149 domain-containing protein n=1 Tax=Thalassotalea psychrophila TaxID=3065647 RepID=A0ABY9TTQ8_9GAMM|nr:DUF2149 domain-containing protein [Colwelliaceae bacterium SQ149]
MRSTNTRHKFLKQDDDLDPLSSLTNLFDVAMVFAVALMVALVQHLNIAEMLLDEDFTMVKNPGKENMEIIQKKGKEISKYKQNQNSEADPNKKRGKRVGVAYQLENGEIIYIPE